MCFFYDYEYPGVVYVSLDCFEPQCHEPVKFRKSNISSCHFDVFEIQGHLLSRYKGYFADANEVDPCYFEFHFEVQFVSISRLMSGNFEKDLPFNEWADGFCVRKRYLAAFNEKVEPWPFEHL